MLWSRAQIFHNYAAKMRSERKTWANKIGAANSAPRLQFCAFGFLMHFVAGSAALTGAVADLSH